MLKCEGKSKPKQATKPNVQNRIPLWLKRKPLLKGASDREQVFETAANQSSLWAQRRFHKQMTGVVTGGPVGMYGAQTPHKAIPIMGSATDRGISSGTEGLE